MSATLDSLTLTQGQTDALHAFQSFVLDPIESVFVLSGYSGCGKTTLVNYMISRLPSFLKTARLISSEAVDYDIQLTATTNKAAENLRRLTGFETKTIHSHLGLRVETNFKTGETKLIPRSQVKKERELIFIDEASYIDSNLLSTIFGQVNLRNCKIVFIGDPAQLAPVKSNATPVFQAQFRGAELTEVVRQALGNPIVDLSTAFRHTVNTGEFFSFTPDGHHVQYLERDAFMAKALAEFSRKDWRFTDSKMLAWTNKRVIDFNNYIRERVSGTPEFQEGDYAICNSFVQVGRDAIKTDALVQITEIGPLINQAHADGRYMQLDGHIRVFVPATEEDRKRALRLAKSEQHYSLVATIENQWADLRAAYACTINKAQGSTYNEVFIDLDDVRRCNSGDQIARMLYVAVSRARNHVFLTGDLI